MSEQKQYEPLKPNERWVAGIVNIAPDVGKDHPYAFFEIDTVDEKTHQFVLDRYKKYNLDCVSHRIGKGYHYFGGQVDLQIKNEWYSELRHLNVRYPPLTLRVTKKFKDEIYERPMYHEAQNVVPNWSKALMFFMNKVIRNQISTDLWAALDSVGMRRYFRCTVYKVEVQI